MILDAEDRYTSWEGTGIQILTDHKKSTSKEMNAHRTRVHEHVPSSKLLLKYLVGKISHHNEKLLKLLWCINHSVALHPIRDRSLLIPQVGIEEKLGG